MSKRSDWKIPSSKTAKRTSNPIRAIVDQMKLVPCPGKDMISLSIGDPAVFGNLPPHGAVINAVVASLQSGKANGYPNSIGYEHARQALANKYMHPDAPLTSQDIIITSGGSGALDIAISGLANEGQNILVPRPGFSLYQTLADSKGIQVRHYNLMPEKSWEIDTVHLESLIDENTAAIVVNNPSNPCGSNYSKEHLLEVLKVAERNFIPIISDEIYADMVYSGNIFYALAPLSKSVPILTCGGIAKQYLAPGWRVGWILIHDRNESFAMEVKPGLVKLSQLILGANSLVQDALPRILTETPKEFYDNTLTILQENAKLSFEALSKIDGLKPIMPQGAMYLMVGIDIAKFKDIKDDFDLTQKLVNEQSVFCLPGQCFKYPNYFRIVLTVPKEKMQAAYDRIAEFCSVHRK